MQQRFRLATWLIPEPNPAGAEVSLLKTKYFWAELVSSRPACSQSQN